MTAESSTASRQYLVRISLGNSGPVLCFSTSAVQVGDQRYEDYLTEVSGVEDSLVRADSGGLNPEVLLVFRNDPFGQHAYLIEIGQTYPFEGAACEIFEYSPATPAAPPETVFTGVLDEPAGIDLMRFECSVSSSGSMG